MATREQVYHDAGRALELANLLEVELGTCLLVLDVLEGGGVAPDADAFRRLQDAIDGHTLGRSIRAIKGKLNITDDEGTMFQDALDARNFLAHRFFPSYGMKIHDDTGRDEMVARIDQLWETMWSAYSAAGLWSSLLLDAARLLARVKAN